MSDNKKYYYLKLKDNYFDQDHIKIIESYENGYIYSLILLKIYLKSIKGDGCLMMSESIPYDPHNIPVLAKVINHDPDHVSKALNLAESLGMIAVIDSKEMWVKDIQNFIGQSSTEGDRIKDYRKRLKNAEKLSISYKCTPEKEIELDIEKKKEKERESSGLEDKPKAKKKTLLLKAIDLGKSITFKSSSSRMHDKHGLRTYLGFENIYITHKEFTQFSGRAEVLYPGKDSTVYAYRAMEKLSLWFSDSVKGKKAHKSQDHYLALNGWALEGAGERMTEAMEADYKTKVKPYLGGE